MNETYVTIRGRLTADPTVRTTRAGAPMTKIRIASSARRQVQGQPGQWEDTEPSFYDVLTYRSLAANMAVSLRKGHPVTVHGRQRVVQWRREDGSLGRGVEIEADAVGHDLTFGTTAFSRVGMGRTAEAWSPEGGAGSGGDRPDEPDRGAHPGDPANDPYVIEGEPDGSLLEDAGSPPVIDTGPLVPAGDEAAA